MSRNESPPARRRQFPDTPRKLDSGLQLFRHPTGPIVEACRQLVELKAAHPSLEVREPTLDSGKRARFFRIEQIRSREVMRRQPDIGHVSVRTALRTMFEAIPSLDEAIPVVDDLWVDTNTDTGGATFINVIPGALDVLRLARERDKGLRVIEALAGSRRLDWPVPAFDLTVAYIPPHAAAGAVHDTVDFLESRGNLAMTLLPAEF